MVNNVEEEGGTLLSFGNWSHSTMYDAENGLDEAPDTTVDQSYTNYSCSVGSTTVTKNVWSGGDENVIGSSELTTYVTRPIVTVYWGSSRCSGALFDDDHVLLAAHCVVNKSTDTVASAEDVTVCQDDACSSVDCAGAEVVNAYSKYLGGHKTKYDWAVIRIDEDLGDSNRYMGLSAASDTTINAISNHTLGGIPGIAEGDEASCDTSNDLIHLSLYGDLDNNYTRTLRLDLTHGSGYSGGPYYYDGATSGGRRYVIGVHAVDSVNGWGNRAAKGPKVPYWRSTMLAMP